jgi:hypothetical protein
VRRVPEEPRRRIWQVGERLVRPTLGETLAVENSMRYSAATWLSDELIVETEDPARVAEDLKRMFNRNSANSANSVDADMEDVLLRDIVERFSVQGWELHIALTPKKFET